MTADVAAMRVALRLNSLPSEVRAARSRALPGGIPLLLAIAAEEKDAVDQGVVLLDRAADVLVASARFFVEQVLLASDSSSYRVLGAAPDAPAADLRRNIALYLKYLHPDRDPGSDRAALMLRVTRAWEDVKTPERRAAYDRELRERHAPDDPAPAGDRRRSRSSGGRGASARSAARDRAAPGLLSRLVRSLL